uniref:ATP synthase complex subunit 8 n=1 Tax=Muraenolepis orangiensis TaxID=630683 RepID=A0A6M4AFU7_9TELE|nr:ATP synthase F0 subunit 8 [Muraenolepis orangiensis]
MPQLNPAPWFMIFAFSWLVLLTILPPKIMMSTSPNELAHQSSTIPPTTSWNWPWH